MMRPLATLSAAFLLGLVALAATGCIVVYAPEARQASVYHHEQSATNMVINETLHDFGQAMGAKSITGISAGNGNIAKVGLK